MSQGGGWLYGVMVVRVLGSVASSMATMTSWVGSWWGFIYLLAGLPSRSMDIQHGGALGLQQEEMMPPSRLLAVPQGVIWYWFAVSFCAQVARGNKSRLMGQGGGCFLLNQPFFFPNPGTRREREQGNE